MVSVACLYHAYQGSIPCTSTMKIERRKSIETEAVKEALKNIGKTVRKNHFEKGLPICYMNDKKEIVYEYPDGRIEKIKDCNNGK